MSESINNNLHGDKIAVQLETDDACSVPCPPAPSWPNFAAHILQQTTNSVSLDWTPFAGARVYSIERYHKQEGWQRAAWSAKCTQTVGQLEENFGYRLRVRALQQAADGSRYETLAISPDVVVRLLITLMQGALSVMTSSSCEIEQFHGGIGRTNESKLIIRLRAVELR